MNGDAGLLGRDRGDGAADGRDRPCVPRTRTPLACPSFAPHSRGRSSPRWTSSSARDDLVVKLEIPGIDPEKDVTIVVQDGSLIIRGDRRQERRSTRRLTTRMEPSYGTFERSILIPEGSMRTGSHGVVRRRSARGDPAARRDEGRGGTARGTPDPGPPGSVLPRPRESSPGEGGGDGVAAACASDDPVHHREVPPRKCGGRKRLRRARAPRDRPPVRTRRLGAVPRSPDRRQPMSLGSTSVPLRPSTIWSWIPPTCSPRRGGASTSPRRP